jgi:hypothetical protein
MPRANLFTFLLYSWNCPHPPPLTFLIIYSLATRSLSLDTSWHTYSHQTHKKPPLRAHLFPHLPSISSIFWGKTHRLPCSYVHFLSSHCLLIWLPVSTPHPSPCSIKTAIKHIDALHNQQLILTHSLSRKDSSVALDTTWLLPSPGNTFLT